MLAFDGAVSSSGADTACSCKSLSTVLKGMLQKAGQLYLTKGVDSIVEARVREVAMQTGIWPTACVRPARSWVTSA